MSEENSPIIRPRRENDVPCAATALVEVHAADGYPVEGVHDPESWLTPADAISAWVAEFEGRVIGHVSISWANGEDAVSLWLKQGKGSRERTAVLARLFVVPAARGKAVGERLVQAATEHAERIGVRLVLDVMAKDAAAIRLYERLGWRKLGVTTHTYGDGQQIEAVCYVSPALSAT
ncbi:GNAT family N-acetyltransferase [Streptomyces sp. NPDC057757]|uniref:GNAT family N-acetyltransferase n=1 Tax=Streptomyces sp. NPDC057757 TaxID=3346241 RepID=UPI0036B31402